MFRKAAVLAVIFALLSSSACGSGGRYVYNGLAGLRLSIPDKWTADSYDGNLTSSAENSAVPEDLEYELDEFGDLYYVIAEITNGLDEDAAGFGYAFITAHLPNGYFRNLDEYAETYLREYYDEGEFDGYSVRQTAYDEVRVNGLTWKRAAYEATESGAAGVYGYDVYVTERDSDEGMIYVMVETEYYGGNSAGKRFVNQLMKRIAPI